MTTADEALQIVLENVAPLGVERVLDYRRRSDAFSPRISIRRATSPGFDNSAMDGYAVRAADVASASEGKPVRLEVLETVAAGCDAFAGARGGPGRADDDGGADSARRRRYRAGRANARRGQFRRDNGIG